MGMTRLAFLNFKSGFKNYLSIVLSLAFTVLVFLNFQNMLGSDAYKVLGTRNKEYIDILVGTASFVLGCFMVFFIWYSTNVFLARRKKEIGVYVFMGLSNERIGQMYMMETLLIGLASLALGLCLGMLSAGLFQMVLLAISDLSVEIQFRPGLKPVGITAAVYLGIYLIFMVKGYLSIAKSSVISMITASKQNEAVKQGRGLLAVKAIVGVCILGFGYSLALKEGRGEVMANAFAAVVLVTVGVYLLFGGMVPAAFQAAAGNKRFLYRKQRVLWINSMVFRLKKNYRTYAIVCILLLCSVTALATGFAMKGRYNDIIRFEHTYTFQLLSRMADLDGEARKAIEEGDEIIASSHIPILFLTDPDGDEKGGEKYAVLSYSRLQALGEAMGMEIPFPKPAEDELFKVSHPVLLSLITDRTHEEVRIGGRTFWQVGETDIPYLGYLQERMNYYVVNDQVYGQLLLLGEENYLYNYRIGDLSHFSQAKSRLDRLVGGQEKGATARVAIDPRSNELDWIKVLYSICVFMFMVFILAGGSIMFMKLCHDGFEERERYQVLANLGVEEKVLKRAAAMELGTAYGLVFLVMAVSSFFSVGALGKMMFTNLLGVNLASLGCVWLVFFIAYLASVQAYGKMP